MTIALTAAEIAARLSYVLSHDEMADLERAILRHMEHHIAPLRQEIDCLRRYGNKDCTGMADAALAEKRATGKAPFEC